MICIISRTEGQGHGAEIVLEELLRAWTYPKTKLLIVSPPNSRILKVAEELGYENIPLIIKKEKILINIIYILKLKPYLKKIKLIHAWQAKSYEIGYFLSKLLNVPLYVTLHDHPLSNIYVWKKQKIIRFVANRSQKVVCVSNAVKVECQNAGYRNNLIVINNGLKNSLKNSIIKKNNYTRIRIGFLGMYAVSKGFDIVANYIEDLSTAENLEWHLYGTIHKNYLDVSEMLKNKYFGKVFFHGDKHSSQIFSNIDLLLHCSVSFDSYPTVLLEAARAGIPVIASNLGGASEIVLHNITGYLFNPKNPEIAKEYIKKLLESAKLRDEMGTNAKKHFESDLTVEMMVRKYHELWVSND